MLITKMHKMRLYLAGPLFSHCERTFNISLTHTLREYYEVFLPQENGSLFADLVANGMAIADAGKQVFHCDIEAVEQCDILLIIMDGRTIDEGAAFELGYAFAKGKLCIGLQTDIRRLLPIGNNPMIDRPLHHVFENVDSLIAWAKANAFNKVV